MFRRKQMRLKLFEFGSVRLRLTALVTAVTAATLFVAVWVGTSQVRVALIEDAVLADTSNLALMRAIETGEAIQESVFVNGSRESASITNLGEGSNTNNFEEVRAAATLARLQKDPRGLELQEALEIDSDDPIPVLFSDGSIGAMAVNHESPEASVVSPYHGDGPVLDVFTLFGLATIEFDDQTDSSEGFDSASNPGSGFANSEGFDSASNPGSGFANSGGGGGEPGGGGGGGDTGGGGGGGDSGDEGGGGGGGDGTDSAGGGLVSEFGELNSQEDLSTSTPTINVELGDFNDNLQFFSQEMEGANVVVAVDLSETLETVQVFRYALWGTSGVLVVLAGLATWLLTGRALAPVRRITAQAADISTGTLQERVPVPNTRDEIAKLGTTVNEMLDRLETADKQRRQFVSDASHELRTPLAVLRNEAEVAMLSPETTPTKELADSVLAESHRMGRLVEDLLALARSDEVSVPRQSRQVVDLDDILLAEASRSRRLAVDRSAVSAGQVLGHPEDLQRVVAHLLDNAARHGESQISVSLVEEAGFVTLCVDDDGPGIAENDRQGVFERFARLEESRNRDQGGAGLGLAVVDAIVGDLGGKVFVETSPLDGARFVVRLPSAES